MRFPVTIAFATAAVLAACAPNAKDFTPKTDDEKALYSLGVLLSENVQSFEFTDQEIAVVKAGLDHGARGNAKIEREEIEKLVPKLQELQTKRVEAASAKAKTDGEAHLAKAATEKGVTKLANGVLLKITQEGTGALPVAADTVKVHYEGKLLSGKVFDSSKKRGEPITFPLAGVVPCWTEGMQQIKVGSKAQLTCPSDQAYGAQGRPPVIPGNSVLVFDVELIEIVKEDPAAAAAAAAAGAPAGAAAAAGAAQANPHAAGH
jgi:FKBP-type peptidyl-prolyl cis-trans isomerase